MEPSMLAPASMAWTLVPAGHGAGPEILGWALAALVFTVALAGLLSGGAMVALRDGLD